MILLYVSKSQVDGTSRVKGELQSEVLWGVRDHLSTINILNKGKCEHLNHVLRVLPRRNGSRDLVLSCKGYVADVEEEGALSVE
jgi:hypothetical protein